MARAPTHHGRVLSWATDLDEKTVAQAQATASMPFVEEPLALMPDAHLGLGSTVGSVVATSGAIMPACVGVDIGCGMIAQRLAVSAEALGPQLDDIHDRIARAVPSGIPNSKNSRAGAHGDQRPIGPKLDELVSTLPDHADVGKATSQFGTLGSGNHFVELCREDETGDAWIVLHSGSRNVGNTIARHHIEAAKGIMRDFFIELPDPDLAYLVEGRPEFDAYIEAMEWAQRYAFANRQEMLDAILAQLRGALDLGSVEPLTAGEAVNCHHNYTSREQHHGRTLWVTRKGAIQARSGSLGVIPGSMATGSFIVEGLGSAASYHSASHGAGRKLSRTAARKRLTTESLAEAMTDIAWNRQPDALLDEHPDAYKDLDEVMENQADLVSIKHRLTTILNYKGT